MFYTFETDNGYWANAIAAWMLFKGYAFACSPLHANEAVRFTMADAHAWRAIRAEYGTAIRRATMEMDGEQERRP